MESVEEAVWKLEEAYFTNLYAANHEGMLALTHEKFLGWPGGTPQPLDKSKSGAFMKRFSPKSKACAITIERKGISVAAGTALTQYVLHAACRSVDGATSTLSSRITHVWIKEGPEWKLLGGASVDQ